MRIRERACEGAQSRRPLTVATDGRRATTSGQPLPWRRHRRAIGADLVVLVRHRRHAELPAARWLHAGGVEKAAGHHPRPVSPSSSLCARGASPSSPSASKPARHDHQSGVRPASSAAAAASWPTAPVPSLQRPYPTSSRPEACRHRAEGLAAAPAHPGCWGRGASSPVLSLTPPPASPAPCAGRRHQQAGQTASTPRPQPQESGCPPLSAAVTAALPGRARASELQLSPPCPLSTQQPRPPTCA